MHGANLSNSGAALPGGDRAGAGLLARAWQGRQQGGYRRGIGEMGFWFGYEAGAFAGGCQIVRGQFGAAPPGGGEQPVAIDDDALLRPGGKVRAAGWFRSLVGRLGTFRLRPARPRDLVYQPGTGQTVAGKPGSERFKMSTADSGCPPGSRPR